MKRMIIFINLLLPSLAFAGEEAAGDIFSTGLKLMGALVIVLGIVLLLYALSRKGFSFLPAVKGEAIKVVEMRHLGTKKALYLVEVRGEEMLLSVGSERIELLSRLGQRDTVPFEETLRSSIEEK
jgi:flagellar protein FliO/FliZ